MPTEILLSPVKTTSLKPPTRARWQKEDDFLVKFASDIVLEGELSDRQAVLSVPTVFARPVYFSQALEDNRHPSHREVRSQWRGLLATFALQRWLQGAVQAKEFSLPEAAALDQRIKAGEGADLPLLVMLTNQLPDPAEHWRRWWLLRFEDKLIGATSPWTIVYTPAEYQAPPSVPWQKKGRFIDPIDFYDPKRKGTSCRELEYLAAWIGLILEGEADRWGVLDQKALEPYMATVARELRRWSQELERYANPTMREPELAGTLAPIHQEPFDQILVGLQIDARRAPSDLLLQGVDGEEVILLSRRNLPPSKRVHGSLMAGQLDVGALTEAFHKGEWRTPSGQEIKPGYVIAEDAFFPERLFELPLTDAAYSVGPPRFALPLTPLFFRFFDLARLQQEHILADVTATATQVLARLHLPLPGGGRLVVERSYDRKTQVIQASGGSPALAYWPDFYEPSWRQGLALCGMASTSNLTVAPLLPGGRMLQTSHADGTEEVLRLWNTPEPPIGFVLFHWEEQTGRTFEAGVVLRSSLRSADPVRERHWSVGVDFGTSSTHLLVQEEGAAGPFPLTLTPRTVLLSEGDSDFYRVPVRTGAFRSETLTPPFPTILYRNFGTLVEGEYENESRRDLYTPGFELVPDRVEKAVKDLKWVARGGAAAEAPLRAYLTWLVRGVCAEAVARGVNTLEFSWSYPLALPESSRLSMQRFWQEAAGYFSIEGRLAVSQHSGVSESEAACRHFARLPESVIPVNAESLSVAVDIGGGSSDIGFWSGRRLVDQASVKLAGNDLLSGLSAFPGWTTDLVQFCDPTRTLGISADLELAGAPIVINALLSQARDPQRDEPFSGDPRAHPVPRLLARKGGAGEPPWSVARTAIYLFGAGLTFYQGLHARKLLPRIKGKEVSIVFGGRGAALFTWLAQDELLVKVLRTAFEEGLTLDAEPNRGVETRLFAPGNWYHRASLLKSEVVQGLLAGSLGDGVAQRPTTTLLGGVGWLGSDGTPLSWDAELTATELRGLQPPPNYSTGFIAHFLTHVVPRFVDELSLDEKGLEGLRLSPAKVQDTLRRSLLDGNEVLQPVFAVELKALLEQYLEQAKRIHG